MKKLLISLGVVAMMFFAQAADVNAKTCDWKAENWCKYATDPQAKWCCLNTAIKCDSTSDADKGVLCSKHCNGSVSTCEGLTEDDG